MFKKLVLSLILAGSTLSMAQSLRSQINSKEGLQGIIRETLNVLSDESYFTYMPSNEANRLLGRKSLTSVISKDPEKLFYKVDENDKDEKLGKVAVTNSFAKMERSIARTLSPTEKNLLRNYIDPGHTSHYNNEKIFNYIKNNLKTKYDALYNLLDPVGFTIYNLTPCYPYTDHSSVRINNKYAPDEEADDFDCSSKYGSDTERLQSLEKATEELFYALTLATFITSVPGCTKYSDARINSGEISQEDYDQYLYRVGSELSLLPYWKGASLWTYSVLDVFNVNFAHVGSGSEAKTKATKNLIASCSRVENLIEEYLF